MTEHQDYYCGLPVYKCKAEDYWLNRQAYEAEELPWYWWIVNFNILVYHGKVIGKIKDVLGGTVEPCAETVDEYYSRIFNYNKLYWKEK